MSVIDNNWQPYPKEKPTSEKESYIVSVKCCYANPTIRLARWATNLESIDDVDFAGDRHEGFYSYDCDFGYYELNVIAWMVAPKPYSLFKPVSKHLGERCENSQKDEEALQPSPERREDGKID